MKEIYIHAWRLFRRNFFPLLIITLVVWVPCEIAVSWMSYHLFSPDNILAPMKLERFANNFFGIIAISASYHIFREREANRPATLGGAFGAGFSYWGWIFATRFIVGVGVIVGLLLLIVPGIYVFVRLALCEVIVVAEDHWAFDAIRRNVQLTQGKFWKTFLWLLGGGVPCAFAAFLVYLPFALIDDNSWTLDAVGSVLSDIPMIFIYPILWAIYARLRDELDGASPAQVITQA